MKQRFLTHKAPLFTVMYQVDALDDALFASIARAKEKGADAFGFQLEPLRREYRTEDRLRDLFCNKMGGLPVYVTSYRYQENEGMTDESCIDDMLLALRAGATLADVMGNAFDREAPLELTHDPVAIEKQKDLIKKIHKLGKEVLMSSHTNCALPAERVLEIAKAHEARGADIAKIVTRAETPEEEAESFKALALLKREMDIPFLYLCSGESCSAMRLLSPSLGNALALCVERYTALSTPFQPPIEIAKSVFEATSYQNQTK